MSRNLLCIFNKPHKCTVWCTHSIHCSIDDTSTYGQTQNHKGIGEDPNGDYTAPFTVASLLVAGSYLLTYFLPVDNETHIQPHHLQIFLYLSPAHGSTHMHTNTHALHGYTCIHAHTQTQNRYTKTHLQLPPDCHVSALCWIGIDNIVVPPTE